MKIQVVKKATKNSKPVSYCAMFIDDVQVSKR